MLSASKVGGSIANGPQSGYSSCVSDDVPGLSSCQAVDLKVDMLDVSYRGDRIGVFLLLFFAFCFGSSSLSIYSGDLDWLLLLRPKSCVISFGQRIPTQIPGKEQSR